MYNMEILHHAQIGQNAHTEYVRTIRPYKLITDFGSKEISKIKQDTGFFFLNHPLEKSKISSTSIVQHLTVYKTEPCRSHLRLPAG